MRWTIKKKFLLIMLILTIIPLFFLGYTAYSQSKECGLDAAKDSSEALRQQGEDCMKMIAKDSSEEIDQFFLDTENSLEGLAKEIHHIYSNPELKSMKYKGRTYAFWATSEWPEHTDKQKLRGILDGTIQNEKYDKLMEMLNPEEKAKLKDVLNTLLEGNFPNLEPASDKARFFPRFMIDKTLWSELYSVVGLAVNTKGNRFALNDFMYEILDDYAQDRIDQVMAMFESAKFVIDTHPALANARMGYWGDQERAVEFTYSRPGEVPFHTASCGIGNVYYCKSPFEVRDNGKVEPVWSTDACTRSDVIKVIHPIYSDFDDPSTGLIGFIEFPIDWDTLSEKVVDVQYGKRGYMLMIDDTGKIIAHPKAELRGTDLRDVCKQPAVVEKMIAGESGTEVFNCPAIGEDIFFTYSPIETTGWSVALIVEVEEILDPADKIKGDIMDFTQSLSLSIIIMSLITIAGACVVGYLFARSLSKPIEELTGVSNKVTGGDFNVAFPKRNSKDEINDLAAAIEMLVTGLKHMKKRCEELAGRPSQVQQQNRTPPPVKKKFPQPNTSTGQPHNELSQNKQKRW